MITHRKLVRAAVMAAACAAVAGGVETPLRADAPRTSKPAAQRSVVIPAGSYMPLYATAGRAITVRSFKLDVTPVTRGQYAEFMKKDLPSAAEAVQPMTRVTRSAARAYCVAQGKRLPAIDEWELAAAASATSRQGTSDPAFRQLLLDLSTRRRTLGPVGRGFLNAYGVRDLHGLVWEWTESADHSHHAANKHDMSCAGSAHGASTTADFAAFLRYAFRAGLTDSSTHENLGFRCAQTVSP